ncbi:unnamed protein product [Caenorhabditis angaria]|uniref:Homeobox domain-containing protein n=1 Tax=Caenorhabditis angaria TaxID=860376 RepID=A0A9P1I5Q7_9PELO|nr:unnamed protein product [Caenorhabditis angaria]
MASFPSFLLAATANEVSTKIGKNGTSSPSTSSAFSIDTLLSASSTPLNISPISSDSFSAQFAPWSTFPFVSMLCSPLLPQFLPPYQHFVSRRKRRHRTIFSEEQLHILETTFLSTHYPDVATREKLAIQCALKEERVEVWFKNRRAKERKQKRDENSGSLLNTTNDGSECDDSDEEMKTSTKRPKKEPSSPEEQSIINKCIQ